MKYYFKTRENSPFVLITPIVAVTAILSLASIQPAQAARITFDFGTGTWVHPNTTSTGWKDKETTGTTTNNGLSLTMTSTFVNGTTGHDDNLTDLSSGTFNGFLMGSKSPKDLLVDNTLNGYQRWNFEFSAPVNLADVTITDIDSGSVTTFVDAIIAEGFTSSPGTIGTGLEPSYAVGSSLTTSNVNLPDGGNLNFVTDNVASNGYQNVNTNDTANHAGVTFTEPVDSFSLYLFNNLESNVTGQHGVGIGGKGFKGETFEITVNEVPFEFSPSLGLLLSGAGLFGVNYLRKRKVINEQTE